MSVLGRRRRTRSVSRTSAPTASAPTHPASTAAAPARALVVVVLLRALVALAACLGVAIELVHRIVLRSLAGTLRRLTARARPLRRLRARARTVRARAPAARPLRRLLAGTIAARVD